MIVVEKKFGYAYLSLIRITNQYRHLAGSIVLRMDN